MLGSKGDLRNLAQGVLRASEPLSVAEQDILRAGQRALIHGLPISVERLGELAGLSTAQVSDTFGRRPGFARLDDTGRIVGLLGLSARCGTHRFDAAGAIVSTWCAWDSLFIPRIIGMRARVASHCPLVQTLIQLHVTPDGIEAASPSHTTMSFLLGCDTPGERTVIGACCKHIHFFSSPRVADLWLADHPSGAVLTLDEAWELARLFVDTVLFAGAAGRADDGRPSDTAAFLS